MIGWLSGVVRHREPGRVIVDVAGVGWALSCPMSTWLALPPIGGVVELHVSTQVREDAITLHGFAQLAEREIFERLLTVSGVGARTAMAALSALGPDDLARCIADGDARRLSTVPGVGKKTAERMIVDLQDRMAKEQGSRAAAAQASGGGIAADVLSALVNLGYNDRQAARAVQDVKGATGFEELLREALSRLGKG